MRARVSSSTWFCLRGAGSSALYNHAGQRFPGWLRGPRRKISVTNLVLPRFAAEVGTRRASALPLRAACFTPLHSQGSGVTHGLRSHVFVVREGNTAGWQALWRTTSPGTMSVTVDGRAATAAATVGRA